MDQKQKVMKWKQKVAKRTNSDKTEQKVMKRNEKQRKGRRDMPISKTSKGTQTKSNEMETKSSKTETKK